MQFSIDLFTIFPMIPNMLRNSEEIQKVPFAKPQNVPPKESKIYFRYLPLWPSNMGHGYCWHSRSKLLRIMHLSMSQNTFEILQPSAPQHGNGLIKNDCSFLSWSLPLLNFLSLDVCAFLTGGRAARVFLFEKRQINLQQHAMASETIEEDPVVKKNVFMCGVCEGKRSMWDANLAPIVHNCHCGLSRLRTVRSVRETCLLV